MDLPASEGGELRRAYVLLDKNERKESLERKSQRSVAGRRGVAPSAKVARYYTMTPHPCHLAGGRHERARSRKKTGPPAFRVPNNGKKKEENNYE